MPILWTQRPGGPVLGYLNMKTEEAYFAWEGKATKIVGKELAEMSIIVRNTKGGPPGCPCNACPKAPPPQLVMLNEWADIRMGDPWPAQKTINKVLSTAPGESPDQSVALWYCHGEPVMGRVWNKNGKVGDRLG